jgi:hypothetical protein
MMSNTLMGDAANMASRQERANKMYGSRGTAITTMTATTSHVCRTRQRF